MSHVTAESRDFQMKLRQRIPRPARGDKREWRWRVLKQAAECALLVIPELPIVIAWLALNEVSNKTLQKPTN
jgi:hypothetical protein